MVFTHKISTRGSLYCTYVFESFEKANCWIDSMYPQLVKKYPGLSKVSSSDIQELDCLKVGDSCYVYGEGSDKFKITGIVSWGTDRYGFVLDNGCAEEVAKCHKYMGTIKPNTDVSNAYDFFQDKINEIEQQRAAASCYISEKSSNRKILGWLYGYKRTSSETIEGKTSFSVKFINAVSNKKPGNGLKKNKDYWEQIVHEGDFSPLYVEPEQYSDYTLKVLGAALSDLEYWESSDRSFSAEQLLTKWVDSLKSITNQVDVLSYWPLMAKVLLIAMTHAEIHYNICRQQVCQECIVRFMREFLCDGISEDIVGSTDLFEMYQLFNKELLDIQVKEYEDSLANALA